VARGRSPPGVGEQGLAFRRGTLKHLPVCRAGYGFGNSDNIKPDWPQRLDRGRKKILVNE
jgi:hypothetical protein